MQKCPDNYDAFEWYEREQERLRRHYRDWDDESDDDDFEEEEYDNERTNFRNQVIDRRTASSQAR